MSTTVDISESVRKVAEQNARNTYVRVNLYYLSIVQAAAQAFTKELPDNSDEQREVLLALNATENFQVIK